MHAKVVITGGPGTGKSTVIEELHRRDFQCMKEISRQVTLEAQSRGVDQLFLEDPIHFSELLLEGRTRQFQEVSMREEVVFFDRGIPDVMAYLNYLDVSFPEIFQKRSMELRYNKVFMMPPWEVIYRQDNERYESYPQAIRIHEHLLDTYTDLGYEVVLVPTGLVEERVSFILNTLEL